MGDITLKISLDKILELALAEQKADIKAYYNSTLGNQTADMLDQFTPKASSILEVLKSIND